MSVSNRFIKYEVSELTNNNAKKWENDNMYKTSYFKQSEKNPLALMNSTEQYLKTKSCHLRSISTRPEVFTKPLENSDYISYDYNSLFRTSYTDMSTKLPKILNSFHKPGYGGFIPGIKADSQFGANITRMAKDNIQDFDRKRISGINSQNTKDWQFNPVSTTNGNFFKSKPEISMSNALISHDYTSKLKESGYTNNHYTMDRTGWVPHHSLNGDQLRTEYRIQLNPKKGIHYSGPLFTTGKLKKKGLNYKHT